MSKEDNLIPFNKLTENEQREIAKSGGIASGESRRRKKQLKDDLIRLLETGDNQNNMCLELMTKALNGDIRAFEVIRDTIGEKPKEQIEERQEVKIVVDDDFDSWGK
jgi:hypothetical protein